MRKSTSASHAPRIATSAASDERSRKVAPVRAQVHARDRDLLVAGGDGATNVVDDVADRTRTAGAARSRNDAVAARLFAAGLHAKRQRGAAGHARRQSAAARAVAVAETWRSARSVEIEVVLLAVRHDERDVRKRGHFVGLTRRVASGDDDLHVRIAANDPSNRLPRALIGARRHRTGVHDDEIRVLSRRFGRTARAQAILDHQRVGLVHAASERHDGVLHRERLLPDVAAQLHPVERNVRRRVIGDVNRLPMRGAAADDGQHAAAGRDELAVTAAGARVKDERAWNLRCGVHAGDDLSALRRFRISARREHDADVRLVLEPRGPRRQRAGRRGSQQPRQIFVQHRQHDLRFGIAEPDVELHDLRTVGRQHQADVQKAAERVSLVLHAMKHGHHDLVEHAAFDVGRQQRARRERAHPAGVRSAIVVEDALVILRGRQRHARRAVGEHEVRRFLADQKLFEHDAVAGRSESTVDHGRAHGRFGRRAIVGDDDALAGGETVGLEHERIAEFTARDRGERIAGRVADAETAQVGTRCRAMKSFANALLLSSWAAARVGPTRAPRREAKRSATPTLSGSSGPTTVRSTASREATRKYVGRLAEIDRNAPRQGGDPGVAGRADNLGYIAFA